MASDRRTREAAKEGSREGARLASDGPLSDETNFRKDRKEKRSKRHAAADAVRRTLERAASDAELIARRNHEIMSVIETLRSMMRSMELERSARIQLQERLTREFTLQKATLKRCVREQDVMLEVALHKLDLHGGAELAAALSSHLHSLRMTAHDAAEDIRTETVEKRTRVPDSLASALTSVHKFLLGHMQQRQDTCDGELAKDAAASKPANQQTDRSSFIPVRDVERLGGLAKSVLEHINGRLATAAKQAMIERGDGDTNVVQNENHNQSAK